MRIPRLLQVAAIFLTLAASCFAQPEGTKVVIQDISWAPADSTVYFSAMRVKKDFSDFKPEKWSIYAYSLATGITTRVIEKAMYVSAAPQGNMLAIGKFVDGKRNIYVTSVHGSVARKLTDSATDDFAPAWSPDGKRIAFCSKRGGKPQIYVIDEFGRSTKQVTDFAFGAYSPNWSADGKLLTFYSVKGDGKDQIWVVEPSGQNPRQLTNDDFNNIYPSFAGPDRIIYGRLSKTSQDLFSISLDGTNVKKLTSFPWGNNRFSKDGSRVAWIDEKEESIVIADSDGTEIAKVRIQI